MTRQKVAMQVLFDSTLNSHNFEIGGAYPHPDAGVRDYLLNCTKTRDTMATPPYAAFLVALFKQVALTIGTWSCHDSEASLAKAWRESLEQKTRNGQSHRDLLYGLVIQNSQTVLRKMLAEANPSQASFPL
jgi:hypothetical protein